MRQFITSELPFGKIHPAVRSAVDAHSRSNLTASTDM